MNQYNKNTYADKLAWSFIDNMLSVLASATVAYEVILFSRLPAYLFFPMFFFVYLSLFILQSKLYNTNKNNSHPSKIIIYLFLLSVFCFSINTFTFRPDADDFSFLHRAVFSLENLKAPFSITHTAHDIRNLPAISPVHLTTSIEVFSVFIAKILRVQPIFFIHNIVGGMCLFFFPLILFVFFRFLGFPEKESLIGTVITIIIYIFSGDSHQDWGNFTITRAWQGKTILICLIVPLASLLTLEYLYHGNKRNLFRLTLAAISGIGLSGTAIFLIPYIVGVSVLGSLLFLHDILKKKYSLAISIIPFLIIIIIIKIGFLPENTNTDVWNNLFKITTNEQINLAILERTIFASKTTFLFYLISIIGIVLFYWREKKIISLALSTVFSCFFIISPPFWNILIKLTLPAAFWRLAYTSQMPLIIAVFILLNICEDTRKDNISIKTQLKTYKILPQPLMNFLGSRDNSNTNEITLKKPSIGEIATKRLLGYIFFIVFLLFKTSSVNSQTIALPHKFKLQESVIDAAKLIDSSGVPQNSFALIPKELVLIGLFRPDIRMMCTRPLETMHVFLNSDIKEDWKLRIEAQQDLNTCGKNGKVKKIIKDKSMLDFFILPEDCRINTIESNLSVLGKDWNIKHTNRYQLWLKRTAQ